MQATFGRYLPLIGAVCPLVRDSHLAPRSTGIPIPRRTVAERIPPARRASNDSRSASRSASRTSVGTPGRYLPLIGVVCGILTPCALGGTLLVPSQYPTIQAGINAAVAGDEVVVADGTYTGPGNKDLDFYGKAITVRSASGDPALCIIDCEKSGRGFYFHSGETAAAVVRGVTIRNGVVTLDSPGSGDGGGMDCASSSPTIARCVVQDCTAWRAGGGVYARSGGVTLLQCQITRNKGYISAGIGLSSANATLVGCEIIANRGVGLDCVNCSPQVSGCVIAANEDCGVYCRTTASSGSYSPILTNCTFSANQPAAIISAGAMVGGATCIPSLSNCILWGDAPQEIRLYSGSAIVAYCNVQGGYAGAGNIDLDPEFALPGDFHLMPGSPCIDVGTNAPPGGLPAQDADGNPRALDGNADGQPVPDMGAYEFNPATPVIALDRTRMEFFVPEGQTDSEGQTLLIRNASAAALSWTLDPGAAWLQANALEGESAGEVDTVTLTPAASVLGHGAYAAIVTVSDAQASNDPRVVEVALYVTKVLQVPSAYSTIQAAIDAAVAGDTVLVADGTYTGAGNKDLDFHGKPITLRSGTGDPANCIIDCQGSGRGFYFHSGETERATMIGVSVRNGAVDADSPGGAYGGAMYCDVHADPTLINCVVSENHAASYGGGLHLRQSSPALIGCLIRHNSAAWGGGIGCGNSYASFTDCEISANTASRSAGGLRFENSAPTLANCAILANAAASTSDAVAGGVFCYFSPAILTDCTVAGNTASSNSGAAAGGIYLHRSATTLLNCAICANRASSDSVPSAGAVYWDASYSAAMTNCTVAGNTAVLGAGAVYCAGTPGMTPLNLANCVLWGDQPEEIHVYSGSAPAGTYCDVQGTYAGTGNINADPLFVRNPSPGPDGVWGTADDDYGDLRLTAGSPCIDAGDNAAVPAGVVTDLDGHPRFVDDPYRADTGNPGDPPRPVVDMGAYEVPFVRGDANCDGAVDFDDISPFVTALVSQAAYEARYPGCPWLNADVDGDADVSFDDINPFVRCLVHNGCP